MMEPVKTTASPTGRASEVEPLLLEVADVVNTTLDLETTLRRVAELVRKVIDYEIFAILLLNERVRNCTSASMWAIRRESPSGRA
jgi:transcriptional regulator with GAF, ATPase, and Fis domain